MTIQETHMQGHGVHEIESLSGEKLDLLWSLLWSNDKSITGTGILVRPKVNFTPAFKRICMMKVKSNNNTLAISAYTPTLKTTVRKPETTRAFYEHLPSVIKTFEA